MTICPHCGAEKPQHAQRRALLDAGFAGQPLDLLEALLRDKGRPVSMETLVDRLWGRRPSGPPLTATKIIYVQVRRLRERYGAEFIKTHWSYVGPRQHAYSAGPPLLALMQKGRVA